jgi:hypothetical protein
MKGIRFYKKIKNNEKLTKTLEIAEPPTTLCFFFMPSTSFFDLNNSLLS